MSSISIFNRQRETKLNVGTIKLRTARLSSQNYVPADLRLISTRCLRWEGNFHSFSLRFWD